MSIKKIKEYIDLAMEGDNTLEQRYQLILEQEKNVEEQLKQLKYYKKQIDFKKAYYEEAIKAGTEDAVRDWPNPHATLKVDELPKRKK